MLNKEKYAKEIVELLIMGVGVALKDNKPVSCCNLYCEECDRNDGTGGCSLDELFEWANSEYKEQILDEAEKEYLSAVVKPFRKSVISIKKLEATYGWEIISFYYTFQSYGCITILPPFEKSSGMYKGMELGKEYTLEELGL